MDRSLRERLCEMTLKPIAEQAAMLERLRGEFAHTIEILDSDHPIEGYTCAVHAFQLVGNTVYDDIRHSGLGKTFAGKDFVEFAIKEQLLTECGAEEAVEGDLVIYLLDGCFGHVGLMQDDQRILSKWGTGYLCEHSLWEIPCSYGLEVRFFRGASAGDCFDIFVEYTKTRGFQWQ
jgi:hypothetical protein